MTTPGPYAPEFRATDIKAVSPGVYQMPLAPGLEAKKGEPSIATLSDRHDYTNAKLVSPLERPKQGSSRFVIVRPYWSRSSYDEHNPDEEPLGWFDWANRFELDSRRIGGGLGFSGAEAPRIRGIVQNGRPVPELLADINAAHWVVAPRVLDLLTEFGIDSGNFAVGNPRWTSDSDARFAEYLLFDAVRLIDSYDYDRSEFNVWKGEGEIYLRLTHRRVLRVDIAPDVHIFRDLYHRDETLISRSLWRFLRDRGVRGLYAVDPAGGAAFFNDLYFHHLDSDPGPGVIDAQ